MYQKKLRSILLSGVVTLSMITGLFLPSTHIRAEEETTSEEEAVTEDTNETGANAKESTETAVPLGELVAYWTFDDNYTESVSGLTTTLGAKKLTYTDGVFGKAAVFNGKDNYLVVDPDSILNLGNNREDNNNNFTISAWINLGDAPEAEKVLLDKGKDINWEKNDGCYWTNPYRVKFNTCEPVVELSNEFEDLNVEPNLQTEGNSSTSGKHVEAQEWFLLTVTYDGKIVKIYHDNELLTQSNYTKGIAFNDDELYIGVDSTLSKFFQGYVDDLRIYTKTLSYDEVDELYQKGIASNKEFVEPTKQMVAYYAFDDNLKDSSSFKNDAEKVAVSGTTKYIIGKNGKAITMSKGNYIRVPAGDQLNFDTEFTASFWIKLDKEGDYPVLYRQNPSYSDQYDDDWVYKLSISSWGDAENTSVGMFTSVYDPDNWTPVSGQSLQSDFTYEDAKLKGTDWFHYAFTYKDGQMKSYLNGVLQEKTDASDLVNIANASGDLLIGYDGETFINGAIDELKIFNQALTETEVEKEAKRIDSISLSSSDAKSIKTIDKGKSVTISEVLLKDIDENKIVKIPVTDKELSFKTSNSKVFSVAANGKITAGKAGKAKLTITYGCHTVTYNIVVK